MTWGTRRALAGVWAMLPFALLLVSIRVWSDPPSQVPTHWSGTYPDGLSDGGSVLVTALVVAGFGAVLASLVALLRVLVPGVWSRWIVAALATVSGGAAAVWGVSAGATRLVGDPAQVHVAWSLLAVLITVAFGVVAYLVHGREVPPLEELLDRIPEQSRVVPARAGGDGAASAHWQGRSRSGLLVGISVFTAVVFAICAGLLLVSDGGPWVASLITLAGVLLTLFVLAWSSILITVDDRGLRIRSARLPVTLLTVAADQVLGVEVHDLDPMRWDGYGLRGTPGRTAFIVRGGDGIVVHRANGTRLALEITEDEPREGAATLLRVAGQALAGSRSGSAPS